ncbi:hypothetical protein DPMN_145726 [Dreissena polymorpha]|uniref:Uncharacterized protein n=1 Tax=Dreissena polymorpha TaxID=45954 RepID=A0A9D4F4M5_DREPO|nr:hypothetical protein DPMN_145726 [Dreissena polymorpha]
MSTGVMALLFIAFFGTVFSRGIKLSKPCKYKEWTYNISNGGIFMDEDDCTLCKCRDGNVDCKRIVCGDILGTANVSLHAFTVVTIGNEAFIVFVNRPLVRSEVGSLSRKGKKRYVIDVEKNG